MLLAFVVAAFLTPDVVSMILMALPLMVLYEISIFSAQVLARRKAATAAAPKTD